MEYPINNFSKVTSVSVYWQYDKILSNFLLITTTLTSLLENGQTQLGVLEDISTNLGNGFSNVLFQDAYNCTNNEHCIVDTVTSSNEVLIHSSKVLSNISTSVDQSADTLSSFSSSNTAHLQDINGTQHGIIERLETISNEIGNSNSSEILEEVKKISTSNDVIVEKLTKVNEKLDLLLVDSGAIASSTAATAASTAATSTVLDSIAPVITGALASILADYYLPLSAGGFHTKPKNTVETFQTHVTNEVNVNVNNQPTVNVGNTPSVNVVAQPIDVYVTNSKLDVNATIQPDNIVSVDVVAPVSILSSPSTPVFTEITNDISIGVDPSEPIPVVVSEQPIFVIPDPTSVYPVIIAEPLDVNVVNTVKVNSTLSEIDINQELLVPVDVRNTITVITPPGESLSVYSDEPITVSLLPDTTINTLATIMPSTLPVSVDFEQPLDVNVLNSVNVNSTLSSIDINEEFLVPVDVRNTISVVTPSGASLSTSPSQPLQVELPPDTVINTVATVTEFSASLPQLSVSISDPVSVVNAPQTSLNITSDVNLPLPVEVFGEVSTSFLQPIDANVVNQLGVVVENVDPITIQGHVTSDSTIVSQKQPIDISTLTNISTSAYFVGQKVPVIVTP